MSIEEIRSLRNAEPFAPFVIFPANGRPIHVVARERLGFAPWGKVGVFEGTHFYLLEPDEITKVQMGFLPRKK